MRRQRGLSLLEVCLVLALLGGVLVCVIPLYPASLGVVRKAQRVQTAADLAQDQLESLRLVPFTDLESQDSQELIDGVWYTIQVTVQNLDVDPTAAAGCRLRQVQVVVSWNVGQEASSSLSCESSFYNFTNPP